MSSTTHHPSHRATLEKPPNNEQTSKTLSMLGGLGSTMENISMQFKQPGGVMGGNVITMASYLPQQTHHYNSGGLADTYFKPI